MNKSTAVAVVDPYDHNHPDNKLSVQTPNPIALALEALRKVDRYGVRSGKQYEGFKALPGGIPMPAAKLTLAEAGEFLYHWTEGTWEADAFAADAGIARAGVRYAARMTHPDNQDTGSVTAFQKLQDVKALLAAHHGVSL